MTKVGVSILSANYMKLGDELERIEQSNPDYLPLDVHLMIEFPEKYIKAFAEAGAKIISVHYEACGKRTTEIIDLIHSCGVKAGIVINPDTPAECIKPYTHKVELILQMTVYPGFGGQKFIASTLGNIQQLAHWKDEFNLTYDIEVDGGINEETAPLCVDVGVNILVAGSFFIDSMNKKVLTHTLQHL